MAYVPENWAELMVPPMRAILTRQIGTMPDYIGEIWNRGPSTKAMEIEMTRGELGLMQPWTAEGSVRDTAAKGFKTVYVPLKYSNQIDISVDMIEDDLFGDLKKQIKALVRSGVFSQQYMAVDFFNNAFAVSEKYPMADGKALCATDHPLTPGSNPRTLNNYLQHELTSDNLEKVREHILTVWKDDRGNPMIIDPSELQLVVPTRLRKMAKVITDSPLEPDITDNNVNVWKGAIDVIEWPWLTNPTAWFVLVKSRAKEFLNWFDRRKLSFSSNILWDDEMSRHRIIGKWSQGATDPSFMVGCKPAA
jgi:phage major head subunit gpT-like protein